jgi:hypothetical protein
MFPLGPSCGLWSTHRGLVAAVVDPDGLLTLAATLPASTEERLAWLSRAQWLCSPGLELVMTEPVARADPLARLALEWGYRVWIAPLTLVTPIAQAAWRRPTAPQLAALLARLPGIRALRGALRCPPPDPGPQQLCLFSGLLGNAAPRRITPTPQPLKGAMQ